jgi:sec-independent protein translocase protein TatA
MPVRFGPLELIILLVIVVLLFGPGRIGKVSGEIGKSIKAFRDGLGGKDEEADKAATTDTEEKK